MERPNEKIGINDIMECLKAGLKNRMAFTLYLADWALIVLENVGKAF